MAGFTAKASDLFVSYASLDRARVLPVVDELERAGFSAWIDRAGIGGGQVYGPVIQEAIRNCKIVLVMTSEAALRSRNVRQEVLLGWKYGRHFLPVLLEAPSQTDQLDYWLEGAQWVEVLDRPAEQWLPGLVHSISGLLAERQGAAQKHLKGLMHFARMTDQFRPVPAEWLERRPNLGKRRGLGAPQTQTRRRYRIGDHVCLSLEVERPGHLLLLDEGPEGVVFCLSPSRFVPRTAVEPGLVCLPLADAENPTFEVSGIPGREQLLAILSDQPLFAEWMPDSAEPARKLTKGELLELEEVLRQLDPQSWTAHATFFDVVP